MIFTKNTMEEHDDIEIRSEEVQEIIGTTPGWILRWGSTAALMVLLLLALMSWFIRYPDTIDAPVVVKTTNSAAPVIAPTSGVLMKIAVKEGENVAANEVLGIMQNSATYEHVLRLEEQINLLQDTDQELLTNYSFGQNLNLGELQDNYRILLQAFDDLKFLSNTNTNQGKIAHINKQIKTLRRAMKIKEERFDKVLTDAEQMEKEYQSKRNEYIAKKISHETLRNYYNDLESIKYNIDKDRADLKASKLENEAAIRDYEKQKKELQSQSSVDNTGKYTQFQKRLDDIQQGINNWKEKYLILSPQDGRVALYTKDNKRNNIRIQNGETIMGILPKRGGEGSLIAEVELPIKGAGKVNAGQKVIVKLAKYPYQEFGTIEGEVEKIGLLPRGDNYIVNVHLPNGLKTSHRKELSYSHEMKGSAQIITEDKRLIERLFEKLIEVVN